MEPPSNHLPVPYINNDYFFLFFLLVFNKLKKSFPQYSLKTSAPAWVRLTGLTRATSALAYQTGFILGLGEFAQDSWNSRSLLWQCRQVHLSARVNPLCEFSLILQCCTFEIIGAQIYSKSVAFKAEQGEHLEWFYCWEFKFLTGQNITNQKLTCNTQAPLVQRAVNVDPGLSNTRCSNLADLNLDSRALLCMTASTTPKKAAWALRSRTGWSKSAYYVISNWQEKKIKVCLKTQGPKSHENVLGIACKCFQNCLEIRN